MPKATHGWKGRCLLALVVLLLQGQAGAHQSDLRIGARMGGGEGLDYYSLFAHWPADWLQRHAVDPWLSNGLVETYWDLSVERWEGDDHPSENTATEVYLFGPVVRVNWPSERLYLLLGVQPSYMAHARIEDDDMGGNIQFTSHAGLVFQLTPELSVGLRGQHTSNSRLYKPNPGMNLGSITLSVRF